MKPLTDAQRDLVAQWTGLVPWVLERYFPTLPQRFREDAYDAGIIGLMHAASKFREGVAQFNTFAVFCIRRRVYAMLKGGRRRQWAREITSHFVADGDGEQTLDFVASSESEPWETLAKADLVEAVRTQVARLPVLLRKAVVAVDLNGQSPTAAKADLHCRATVLEGRRRQARDMLRRRFSKIAPDGDL